MSTAVVVIIIVAAVVIVALLALAASRRRRAQLGQVQGEALHEDVDRHRSHAEEARHEAALADERAKRTAVEAELEERRAEERERDLNERR